MKPSGASSCRPARQTVVEIMDAVHAGEIKGMYVEGENPAMWTPISTTPSGA